MADDLKKPEEGTTPPATTPAAPKARKYTYTGTTPGNRRAYNMYGALKIRPWEMTDDEIDKLLKIRPDLGRLWKSA